MACLRRLMRHATKQIREKFPTEQGVVFEVEQIATHVLGLNSRSELLLEMSSGDGLRFSTVQAQVFDSLVQRRCGGEPLAYLTNKKAFREIILRVTPDTLIPRADSEVLVDEALARMAPKNPSKPIFVDLCCGSGALLLSLQSESPGWSYGYGLDCSLKALEVARMNARDLAEQISGETEFILGNVRETVDIPKENCDVILCNPPYIGLCANISDSVKHYEPHMALFPGDDEGLSLYHYVAKRAEELVSGQGGLVVVEIGVGQADDVVSIFTEYAPLLNFEVASKDLSGIPRALVFRK